MCKLREKELAFAGEKLRAIETRAYVSDEIRLKVLRHGIILNMVERKSSFEMFNSDDNRAMD